MFKNTFYFSCAFLVASTSLASKEPEDSIKQIKLQEERAALADGLSYALKNAHETGNKDKLIPALRAFLAFPENFDPKSANPQSSTESSDKSYQEYSALIDATLTCDTAIYSKALRTAISQKRSLSEINHSLSYALVNCNRSGNLHELVQTNIDHGGRPAQQDFDFRGEGHNDYHTGYDSTALGILARNAEHPPYKPGTTFPPFKDNIDAVRKSVNILADHGCSKDAALVDSVAGNEFSMAQLLMEEGASMFKPVSVSCPGQTFYRNGVEISHTSSAIGKRTAFAVAKTPMAKIQLIKAQLLALKYKFFRK